MKLNVLDLFAGAGGFSAGFKQAGYNILAANEIDSMIAETYKRNHPNTLTYVSDIKIFKDKLDSLPENIDVIIGGPPCQGFSMAGARNRENKHEKFINDERNLLFREYIEIVKKLKPKAFIMENVEGLVTMDKGSVISEIVELLGDNKYVGQKYKIEYKIINMSDYGIPQIRKRVIIVGYRSESEHMSFFDILKNKREGLVTVKDAIYDLMGLENTIPNHTPTKHSPVAISRMKRILPGENYAVLGDTNIKSIHSGSYGRMVWNNPSKTITTRFDTPSGGEYIHPKEHRTITPREAARIQTFDDNYTFYGNKSSIIRQIGNAVPPKMAYKIAVSLKEIL